MGKILSSDLLKIRRKMIWFLIFLGPIGVIALQTLNFTLRHDYLTKLYSDDLWGGLIMNVQYLSVPALLLGLTIIASQIAGIEHQTNSWKQLLALPVSKGKVFAGKFILVSLLLLVSTFLLAIGTIILGLFLGFGAEVPVLTLLEMIFYPYFASMAFIALQIWLSVTLKNQAIPLTIGIFGTVISLYAMRMPDWMPWKWPLLINQWETPFYSALFGLAAGIVIYVYGLLDFVRKDVG